MTAGLEVNPTAERFLEELKRHGDSVAMGKIFALAKAYGAMELAGIRVLLCDAVLEVRVGAVSIMDFQARDRRTSAERRRELYELYIDNYEHIDHWGLVDRAAPYVVGGYLSDKSREPLYELARSDRPMERRTAIVATYYFIRQHDLDQAVEAQADVDEELGLVPGHLLQLT